MSVSVCLSVCLSVRKDISGTLSPILTTFYACFLWPCTARSFSDGVVPRKVDKTHRAGLF